MMKDSMKQDQQITRELGRYRLTAPSPGLRDRVLQAGREAWESGGAELNWTDRWLRACSVFRQEILAFASAILLILGAAMQIAGGQSILANSIEQWTLMTAATEGLSRATSMDCTLIKPGAGDAPSQYRVRWSAAGVTRVDMNSIDTAPRTLWISEGAILATDPEDGSMQSIPVEALSSEGQPPKEYLSPEILAQCLKRYQLTQVENQERAKPGELRLAGLDGSQTVELFVDVKTGLPKTMSKCLPASAPIGSQRICSEEVGFRWNEPIPKELLVPGMPVVKHPVR